MEHHQKAKKKLKGKRVKLMRELLETGRDIIQCRREYGQLYNSRSVFSKLPKEIVILIFDILVAEGRATGVPLYPLPEVTVSHVCSRWRQLALSTASLWSFFHFDGTVCDVVPNKRLETYLERSQDKPFDLWLRLVTDHDERECQKGLEVVLYEHAHRLRLCRLQADD